MFCGKKENNLLNHKKDKSTKTNVQKIYNEQ